MILWGWRTTLTCFFSNQGPFYPYFSISALLLPIQSGNGKNQFFLKKSKKSKKNFFLFFIDVKLDFMRLVHNFDTFFFESGPFYPYFSISALLLPVQSGNGKNRFFGWKRSKSQKIFFILFIDVKLDFMRLVHHFDTFIRIWDRFILIFRFQHYCFQPA